MRPKPFALSQHADWSTLTYSRQRSDAAWVEFEKGPPEFYGADLMNGILAVLCGASLLAVLFVVVR